MKKTLLLYNFTPDRIKLVRQAVKPLDCTVRTVTPKEFAQPIAALTGRDSALYDKRLRPCDPFCEELLVMDGFFGGGLDILLAALRKNGIVVPLKAVVTEHNGSWSGEALYREVKAEHEALAGR